MDIPRFHIAFPVDNLENAKDFYTKILGCSLGRESDKWIDFNLYGHQIVAHFSPEECIKSNANKVDDDMVPCRHFGVILPWDNWEALGVKIKKKKAHLPKSSILSYSRIIPLDQVRSIFFGYAP